MTVTEISVKFSLPGGKIEFGCYKVTSQQASESVSIFSSGRAGQLQTSRHLHAGQIGCRRGEHEKKTHGGADIHRSDGG